MTPCDAMFLAVGANVRAETGLGLTFMLTMETLGEIEPGRLALALERTLDAHPCLRATARTSSFRGSAHWDLAGDASPRAASRFSTHDLRDRADWPDCALRLLEEHHERPVDPRVGPVLQLLHFQGPDTRGMVVLSHPHALLDLTSAIGVMSEICRFDDPRATGLPSGLRPCGEPLSPLAGLSARERLRLTWRGATGGTSPGTRPHGLCLARPEGRAGLGVRRRQFDAAELARIRSHARALCPPGQGLYSRYLAGATLRALHRTCTAEGVDVPVYAIPFVRSLLPHGPRPVHGNYVGFDTLYAYRDRLEPDVLARDLDEQLRASLAEERHLASWAALRALGLLPAPLQRRVLRSPEVASPVHSGFSYSAELDRLQGTHFGARVTNVWGHGPESPPAGCNPIFTRFEDTLTLAFTWIRGWVRDSVAATYLTAIEDELLGG